MPCTTHNVRLPTYTITVRVEEYAGYPVPDEGVYMDGGFEGFTDSEGEVTIEGVPEGDHRFEACMESITEYIDEDNTYVRLVCT